MIFFHIVDDFYLQGILAKLKQRDFWEKNAPDPLYKNDYKIALFIHGFSWSFMVNVPVFVYLFYYGLATNPVLYACCVAVLVHGIIHSSIDNLKANKRSTNLIIDQAMHMIQILYIWIPIALMH